MKILKIALITVLCCLVAACGKSTSGSENIPAETKPPTGEQVVETTAEKVQVEILSAADSTAHIEKLKKAFAADGFTIIKKIVKVNGKYGIRAENPNALNSCTKQPKMVLYLSGNPYEMGFQTGLLAEPEVTAMAVIFVETIAPSFVAPGLPLKIKLKIGKELDKLLLPGVRKLAAGDAIPAEYNQQIAGILEGCQKANPNTKVTLDGLNLLNYAQNVICGYVNHGHFFEKNGLKHSHFAFPMMCNAFSLSGKAVKDGKHYFGRDLMFVTGGVLQDTGCLILYDPDTTHKGKKALPQVGYTAPGFVGVLASININGLAMGQDMFPSVGCDPENPGIDPLIMARHALQYGRNVDEAVRLIKEAKRGVSWFYPFADSSTGKSGVIEAIQSMDPAQFPTKEKLAQYFLDFALEKPASVPLKLLMGKLIKNLDKHIPGLGFIVEHMQQFENLRRGIFVRWSDYRYPEAYIDYNKGLWDYYNKVVVLEHNKTLYKDAFAPEGLIDRVENNKGFDKNCPASFYFAPQREELVYDVLVTNSPIAPEFRLLWMNYWTAAILEVSNEVNDIQWRYDELNRLILKALKKGPVDEKTALDLVDFLRPDGLFPFYYAHNPKCKNNDSTVINGSVSLFELKEKVIHCHFGYYSDPWVTVTLPRYFD